MNFLLSFTDSSIILWDFNMNFILSFTENNNTEKLEENERKFRAGGTSSGN